MKYGIKLVYLVKQLIHIKITLQPSNSEKLETKHMLQEVSLDMGIGNDCSRPERLPYYTLNAERLKKYKLKEIIK